MTAAPGAAGHPRRDAIAMGAAYAAFYLAIGIQLPFLPLWLTERGLSPQEIGVVIAAPLVARLFATPLIGFLSDRLGRPKAVLVTLALVTCAGMALLALSRDFLLIVLVLGATALFWNPSFALLDSYATRLARAGRADYGRARQWGSASFVVANLAGGAIIGATGNGGIVLMMLAGQLIYLAVSTRLPPLAPAPAPVAGAAGVSGVPWRLVAAIVAVALVQASHSVLYVFGSVHWRGIGLATTTIGLLWSLGVIAEICVFRWGTVLMNRFGPHLLIAAGGVCAIVRFGALAFGPPEPALFALQLLHGLTFGATYLGMVELIARSVGEHRSGSGQALASWAVSLAMSGASLAAGPLWAAFGIHAFLMSAGLGLLGALVALVARPQPHSSGAGGKASAPS
ncbi:MFS transporter [Xanthobacter pseudotagetidis]|uniref:MFS transporter n=1 Tax=Xanthobacter pseudotagetidis TaxID=3119911 RepID=UPI00372BC16C